MTGPAGDGGAGADRDLHDATALLDAELPDRRFVDDDYLRWIYRENPLGPAIERHHREPTGTAPGLLVAHYAIVPRRWRGPGGERSDGAWSLNAVVRSGHQRGGHFSRLGLEIYQEAAERSWSFVVGVTNERSTGAVVKYMGWRLIGPLPVRVVDPVGPGRRGVDHVDVDDAWLDSTEFDDLAATVDRHAVDGWATDYSPAVLRWRLACPHTRYRVHVADDVAVVTTRSSFGPIPATVVLKVFPLVGGPGPVDATRTVRSIVRHERTAFGVWAGFSGAVRVRGLPPPRRVQPSPLNLIVRRLHPAVDQDALVLDTFEFLDMDAY